MPPKKTIDDAEVLEKALLVISEMGPDNFTLQDVGNAVNLAPATLMQRFGSKQALLIQAAKHAPAKMKQDLEILKEKGLPWEEELMELLAGIPEGFGTRQEIANSLGLLKLDMTHPELHPIARELFLLIRQRLQEILEKGKRMGELPIGLVSEELAWELDALKHGLIIQWTLSGEGSLRDWLQRGFRKYLQGKKDEISVLPRA